MQRRADLLEVDVDRAVWSKGGRPFPGKALRFGFASLFLGLALVVGDTTTRIVFLVTGVVALLFIQPLMDSRLEALGNVIAAADRRRASRLLASLDTQRLVKLFASHGWVALQRGRLNLVLGNGRAAAKSFFDASRILGVPELPALVSAQAHALMIAGDRKEARPLLQSLEKRELLSPRDRIDLGLALLEESGRAQLARTHLEAAREQLGGHPRVLAGLALASARTDDGAGGMALLEAAERTEGLADDELATELVKRAKKALRPVLEAAEKRARKAPVAAGGRAERPAVAATPAKPAKKERKDRRKERREKRRAGKAEPESVAETESDADTESVAELERVAETESDAETASVAEPASVAETERVVEVEREEASDITTLPVVRADAQLERRLEESAAKRRADDEAAAAKRRAEEEAAAAKRRADDEAAAAKRRAEEEAAAAKRRAEEEAAAKRRADEEAAAKRRAEEEAAAKRRAEEEAAAAKRRAEEEAALHRAAAEAEAQKQRLAAEAEATRLRAAAEAEVERARDAAEREAAARREAAELEAAKRREAAALPVPVFMPPPLPDAPSTAAVAPSVQPPAISTAEPAAPVVDESGWDDLLGDPPKP